MSSNSNNMSSSVTPMIPTPTSAPPTPPTGGFRWNPYSNNDSIVFPPSSPKSSNTTTSTPANTPTGSSVPQRISADEICPNVIVTTRAQKRGHARASSSGVVMGSDDRMMINARSPLIIHHTSPVVPGGKTHNPYRQPFSASSDSGSGDDESNRSRNSSMTGFAITPQRKNSDAGTRVPPPMQIPPSFAFSSASSPANARRVSASSSSSSCGADGQNWRLSVTSVPSNSSLPTTPCGDVSNNLPFVLRWINYARSMNSDEKVETCISGLGSAMRHRMLEVIVVPPPELPVPVGHQQRQPLFVDLCKNERGNVIVQLLQQLALEQHQQSIEVLFSAVLRQVNDNWEELSQSQLGAIALSRIFRTFPPAVVTLQQEFAQRTLASASMLTTHRFGNFIVSEVIKAAGSSDVFDFVLAHLAQEWSQPQVFTTLAESKFGSHVAEAFFQSCSTQRPQYLFTLAQPLLVTPEGIETCLALANHKQGNYPLQALLRALAGVAGGGQPQQQQADAITQCAGLVAEAKKQILPRLPQGTIFGKNLSRALKSSSTTTGPSSRFGGMKKY